MLTASSEPCIGTDRQVASGFRENHAFCAGRPDLLPDWSVKERLKAPARQNPVAQCHPIRQSCPQSAFSWGPSGKCRLNNGVVNIPGITVTRGNPDPLNPNALPLIGDVQGSYANMLSELGSGIDFAAIVRTGPAATKLTRMPSGPKSRAK